nr:immunoglobulin heavy chain junction region [Macaca mulatta]MOV42818.1 immunoglobulin heavy chain junction region [Macaca mulatta]MOV42986.1 immunoglobulin heavy chain junction region [Macaca mulatta]MOV43440.1 immunoglobulin heavy chain junction region [Macaca mulatta]MOV43488.1 immunoglobulin heavy chain junction region [Macaca mulatta]
CVRDEYGSGFSSW